MTDSLYKEFILDLYRYPLHKKVLDHPTHTHTATNASCGDEFTVQLEVDQDGMIQDVGFQGEGCAIATAAVSLMAEKVLGKKKEEIDRYALAEVVEELGVSIDYTREKCAMIGLSALQKALESSI